MADVVSAYAYRSLIFSTIMMLSLAYLSISVATKSIYSLVTVMSMQSIVKAL